MIDEYLDCKDPIERFKMFLDHNELADVVKDDEDIRDIVEQITISFNNWVSINPTKENRKKWGASTTVGECNGWKFECGLSLEEFVEMVKSGKRKVCSYSGFSTKMNHDEHGYYRR